VLPEQHLNRALLLLLLRRFKTQWLEVLSPVLLPVLLLPQRPLNPNPR
jgi:hypothetical protein